MNVYLEDNQFLISGQGLCLSWPDVGINRKLAVVFLRSLRSAQTGRPLFTLQELSGIVGSRNRQAASEHMEQFRGCGEDFGEFIKRRRKVDEEVVEAVEAELLQDPLAGLGELCKRVGERLDREDLTGGIFVRPWIGSPLRNCEGCCGRLWSRGRQACSIGRRGC
jgi:hypothetical protein